MAESQSINLDDDSTTEVENSSEIVDRDQGQTSFSVDNSEELLKELLLRQKGLDNLLNRFLEEQTTINNQHEETLGCFLNEQRRRNDNVENTLEEIKCHLREPKTVEGKENPGGTINPMGSDRAIPDTTLGYTWLGVTNPNSMSLGQERVPSEAAPNKSVASQTSIAPSSAS